MPKGDKLKLKADPEDGTTPIANLLLEAVAIASLSGIEKGIILYLWRQTYGWVIEGQRIKETTLGQDTLADIFSVSSRSIYSSLKSLADKRILLRKDKGSGKGYLYHMNTNISDWNSHSVNHKILREIAGIDKPIRGSQYLLPSTEASTVEATPETNSEPSTETSTVPLKETSTPPSTETSGPTLYKEILKKGKKDIYGEFKNVLLTDTELQNLKEKFSTSYQTKIENLSEWLASTGKKRASHYATILNWSRRDDKENKPGGTYHGTNAAYKDQPPGTSTPVRALDGDAEAPPEKG